MPRKAPSWLGDEATWVRAGLWLALLGTVAGGVSCSREKPESCEPARHVIVISLDTTRADHLGCYGNTEVRTPNIDALAAESILFTDYMTVVPTTLSSHLSLFTGKYSHTHGTPRNGFMVNRENLLLTEILQEAGFHTAGFIGSFALESRFDFNQGFDHYDERFERFVSVIGAEHNERPAESVTNAVISYLDEIGIPDKLLLFVHYFDPHEPYDPPPPYNTMYGGARRVTPEHTEVVRQGIRQAGHEATVEAQVLARNYAGEISYMDEHVGRLLEDLRQRGVLDQALVLVTSDHGENFWEHRFYFNHGLTTYQTTLHAVCLLRLPRAAHGGTRVEQLVASIDVLPTLLSYLGLEIPPGVEGEALDLAR
ncbi:MAG: sulfatase, partial [Planctomycetes bacterium]|nr:sulfatase [Planctomycetota bacterium]